MSEESDFNEDFELDSRSYEQPTTPAMSKLKARSRNGCIAGVFLIISPAILVGLSFILPQEQRDLIFIPLLLVSGGLGIIGVAIACLYGTGSKSLSRAYEILQALGPPESQLRSRYIVKEYRDVYIIGQSVSGRLHLVAFRDQAGLTSASKMSLSLIHKRNNIVDVSGYRFIRSKGVFSVPTERGDYVSGEGVLYSQGLILSRYRLSLERFIRDALFAIIERVSEEAKEPPSDYDFS
jgi:hypothetical protein